MIRIPRIFKLMFPRYDVNKVLEDKLEIERREARLRAELNKVIRLREARRGA